LYINVIEININMKNRIVFFIAFSLLFINKAGSVTYMGSGITWQCVGQDSFIISLTLYRDCNACQMGSGKLQFKCAASGTAITSITIPRPIPVDITPTCDESCNRCVSGSCSFPYGVQKYTYVSSIVDLSSAGSCCDILVSYQYCCRLCEITTIVNPSSKPFYYFAQFNRCLSPCKNSPVFSHDPVMIACKNQNFIYNPGVYDPDTDAPGKPKDSLVFEWIAPMASGGVPITYMQPYDYDKPIYFWGFPNTAAVFPRGFHLNPVNGDIMFRPMKQEVTVMVLGIKIYRDSLLIGYVMRDFMVYVIDCPVNAPPVLGGNFHQEVCA
jgi:hypothetical protein